MIQQPRAASGQTRLGRAEGSSGESAFLMRPGSVVQQRFAMCQKAASEIAAPASEAKMPQNGHNKTAA
jgi:hypothetical protein